MEKKIQIERVVKADKFEIKPFENLIIADDYLELPVLFWIYWDQEEGWDLFAGGYSSKYKTFVIYRIGDLSIVLIVKGDEARKIVFFVRDMAINESIEIKKTELWQNLM